MISTRPEGTSAARHSMPKLQMKSQKKFIVFCSTNLPIQQRQLQVVKNLWRLETNHCLLDLLVGFIYTLLFTLLSASSILLLEWLLYLSQHLGILQNKPFSYNVTKILKYSKALRYTASSCTDLGNACF